MVAVKALKPTNKLGDQERFLEEAKKLQNLHHQNIVQLYGVSTLGEETLIVLEYMKHGSLQGYLRKRGWAGFPFKKLIDIILQVI